METKISDIFKEKDKKIILVTPDTIAENWQQETGTLPQGE